MFDPGEAPPQSILFASRKPGRLKIIGVATALDRDGSKTLAAVRQAIGLELIGGRRLGTTLTIAMEIVYDPDPFLAR